MKYNSEYDPYLFITMYAFILIFLFVVSDLVFAGGDCEIPEHAFAAGVVDADSLFGSGDYNQFYSNNLSLIDSCSEQYYAGFYSRMQTLKSSNYITQTIPITYIIMAEDVKFNIQDIFKICCIGFGFIVGESIFRKIFKTG